MPYVLCTVHPAYFNYICLVKPFAIYNVTMVSYLHNVHLRIILNSVGFSR